MVNLPRKKASKLRASYRILLNFWWSSCNLSFNFTFQMVNFRLTTLINSISKMFKLIQQYFITIRACSSNSWKPSIENPTGINNVIIIRIIGKFYNFYFGYCKIKIRQVNNVNPKIQNFERFLDFWFCISVFDKHTLNQDSLDLAVWHQDERTLVHGLH